MYHVKYHNGIITHTRYDVISKSGLKSPLSTGRSGLGELKSHTQGANNLHCRER